MEKYGTVMLTHSHIVVLELCPKHKLTTDNVAVLVVAGLLVGFGSTVGSGCTSGHGVCGLSRLSIRSLVATGVFMTAGILTVFVARHVL